MKEDMPFRRLFSWTYVSLVTAQVLIMWLGAAFMTCVPGNPAWEDALIAPEQVVS
jgi:hypothetical protein